MIKVSISLKRVQTFIFEIPRLKAMIGANALIGHVVRHELSRLVGSRGVTLKWPENLTSNLADDPLNTASEVEDYDSPSALFEKGVLARDGGHFIAVFNDETTAKKFKQLAETKLAEMLPEIPFEIVLDPVHDDSSQSGLESKTDFTQSSPREIQVLDLPILQVCQETGRGPASERGTKVDWMGSSASLRYQWGDRFRNRGEDVKDIVSLMHDTLYPADQDWKVPDNLNQLASQGYLSVIHADGNGIGKRYDDFKRDQTEAMTLIDREAYGESFFRSMRYAMRKAVVEALNRTFSGVKGYRPYEVLMLAGDDLLLLCRAEYSLTFASKLSSELSRYELADGKPLDVAIGIATAKSEFPLHRLHTLAEDLASSAKRLYRSSSNTQTGSVVDWQIVTQSWFDDVREARAQSEQSAYVAGEATENLVLTGRPYFVSSESDSLDELLEACESLVESDEEVARSPLRSLRAACEHGRLAGEMAFRGLPNNIRKQLAWQNGELWKHIEQYEEEYYITRALDIVGIREISHLGRNRHV